MFIQLVVKFFEFFNDFFGGLVSIYQILSFVDVDCVLGVFICVLIEFYVGYVVDFFSIIVYDFGVYFCIIESIGNRLMIFYDRRK